MKVRITEYTTIQKSWVVEAKNGSVALDMVKENRNTGQGFEWQEDEEIFDTEWDVEENPREK